MGKQASEGHRTPEKKVPGSPDSKRDSASSPVNIKQKHSIKFVHHHESTPSTGLPSGESSPLKIARPPPLGPFTVLMVGGPGTGKTAFASNLQGIKVQENGPGEEQYIPTCSIIQRSGVIEDPTKHELRPVELLDVPIWALPVNVHFFQKADAVIFFFDCTKLESLDDNVNHWLHIARYHKQNRTSFMFVGTKEDLGIAQSTKKRLEERLTNVGLQMKIGSNAHAGFGCHVIHALMLEQSRLANEGSDPPDLLRALPQFRLPDTTLEIEDDGIEQRSRDKEHSYEQEEAAFQHSPYFLKMLAFVKAAEAVKAAIADQKRATLEGTLCELAEKHDSLSNVLQKYGWIENTADGKREPPYTTWQFEKWPNPRLEDLLLELEAFEKAHESRPIGHGATTSLCLCGYTNPIRRIAIAITSSPTFDACVLLLIFLNCLTFVLEDPPLLRRYPRLEQEFLPLSSTIFTVIFSVEALLQIISQGFLFGKKAYLRSGWNKIDFVCVVSSIVGELPFIQLPINVSYLRVLRPLRAVNKFPSLQFVVNSLLGSLPMLVNVLVLCCFFFVIFGLIGVQLFGARLRPRHCLDIMGTPYLDLAELEASYPQSTCTMEEESMLSSDAPSSNCPPGFTCELYGQNPNYGYTSFDNIGSAVLTIFVLITIEAWGDVMYMVEDFTSPDMNIYFVLVVFFGGLFIINMVVAVIYVTFKDKKDEHGRINNEKQTIIYRKGMNNDISELASNSSRAFQHWMFAYDHLVHFRQREMEQLRNYKADMEQKRLRDKEAKIQKLRSSRTISKMSFKAKNFWSLLKRGRGSASVMPKAEEDRISQGLSNKIEFASRDLRNLVAQAKDEKALGETLEAVQKMETAIQEARVEYLAAKRRGSPTDFQNKLWKLLESSTFQNFITTLILLNTIVMACDHHDIEENTQRLLNLANQFFLYAFVFEFVAKLIAQGPMKYCSDKFNLFDGAVTLISVAESLLMESSMLTVLRLLRIFRLFRLARAFPAFSDMLLKIARLIPKIASIGVLLMLTTFIFAIAGRAIFTGRLDFHCEEKPRHHFDKLFWAMVTNFQLLTGENWPTVLLDSMRGASHPAIGAAYCLLCITIQIYFVLALFLAVLIDEFSSQSSDANEKGSMPAEGGDLEDKEEEDDEGKDTMQAALTMISTMPNLGSNLGDLGASTKSLTTSFSNQDDSIDLNGKSLFIFAPGNVLRVALFRFVKSKWFDNFFIIAVIGVSAVLLCLQSPVDDTYWPENNEIVGYMDISILAIFTFEAVLKIVAYGFFLHTGSYLRDPWNVLDFVSVVISWLDITLPSFPSWLKSLRAIRALRPLKMASRLPTLRAAINATFTSIPASIRIIFVLYIFISIFAICGVSLFKGAFSQCTDECILHREDCVGFYNPDISFIDEECGERRLNDRSQVEPQFSPLLHFRQDAFSILASYPSTWDHALSSRRLEETVSLSNTTVANDTSWPHWPVPDVQRKDWAQLTEDERGAAVTLGLNQEEWGKRGVGLETLRTNRRWLSLNSVEQAAAEQLGFTRGSWDGVPISYLRSVEICPDLKTTCRLDRTVIEDSPGALPRIWYRLPYNFDNYLYAMLSLYEVATLEGWVDIMYRANDIVGPDIGPCRDSSELHAVFFVLYIFVCSFFALNLFMSVVIENFDKQLKAGTLLPQQMSFVLHIRSLSKAHWIKPQSLPDNFVSLLLRQHFAESRWFESFIQSLVLGNLLFMCTYIPENDALADYRGQVDVTLLAIFVLEAIIKLVALGGVYFDNSWNIFDLVIVMLSGLSLGAGLIFPDFPASLFLVIKIMRSFRVAKLLRRFKGVGTIVKAVIISLPNVINIAILLCLCFGIYSLAGMQLYGLIPAGFTLGKHMNFRNFPRAMLTLFYLATGEYWNSMMHDVMEPPSCFPTAGKLLQEAGVDWSEEPCEDPLQLDGSCCPAGMWEVKHYSAIPFFISYMILSNFILLNVVIGIVLDSFMDCSQETKGLWVDHFESFQKVWFEFDFSRNRVLHVSLLSRFIRRLPEFPFKSVVDSNTNTILKVSERVLLFCLHAPVMPGDVVSMVHVWIALLYIHNPFIIELEDMEKRLQRSYSRFKKISQIDINEFSTVQYTDRSDPYSEMLFTDTLFDAVMIQYFFLSRVGPRLAKTTGKKWKKPTISLWYLSGHVPEEGAVDHSEKQVTKELQPSPALDKRIQNLFKRGAGKFTEAQVREALEKSSGHGGQAWACLWEPHKQISQDSLIPDPDSSIRKGVALPTLRGKEDEDQDKAVWQLYFSSLYQALQKLRTERKRLLAEGDVVPQLNNANPLFRQAVIEAVITAQEFNAIPASR